MQILLITAFLINILIFITPVFPKKVKASKYPLKRPSLYIGGLAKIH